MCSSFLVKPRFDPQVTAPVRETAAQALGTALRPLELPALRGVLGLLRQLVTAPVWEARHGGLLALKYLLAARPDAASQLLPDALPAAMIGLQVRVQNLNPVPSNPNDLLPQRYSAATVRRIAMIGLQVCTRSLRPWPRLVRRTKGDDLSPTTCHRP